MEKDTRMPYSNMQFPTRQEMRNEIERLTVALTDYKIMLFTVTAVCNGSSAMEHLDTFRTVDAMLQEDNNEKLKAVLDEVDQFLNTYKQISSGSELHQKLHDVLCVAY